MLLALALVPVIGLLCFIYFNDKNEKEPFWLLTVLFFAGMSTVISAIILELLGELMLDAIMPYDSVVKSVLLATIIVAPAEELGKYLVLRLITWKNRHFNYSYDAIVYAVFVSLGFAALENVGYVIGNGVFTALLRMFTAVPGHACYGVIMGYFYSKAKYAQLTEKKSKSILFRLLAIFVPIILHGIYDAILMGARNTDATLAMGLSLIIWIGIVIALFVVSIILIIRSSRRDFCIVTLPEKNVQTVYVPRVAGTWTCSCGVVNQFNFCPKCGKIRPYGNTWYCQRCGALSAYNFCGNCGTQKPMV